MNEQTISRRRRIDPARASGISGGGASRLALLAAVLAAFGVSACASDTAPARGPTLTRAEQGASRPTAAIDPLTGTV
jgi:hypothetical protein